MNLIGKCFFDGDVWWKVARKATGNGEEIYWCEGVNRLSGGWYYASDLQKYNLVDL